jgi:hypothetical protein
MVWSSLITPIGLFLYGWTAEFNLNFMLPILSSALMGVGLLFIMVRLILRRFLLAMRSSSGDLTILPGRS